MAYRARIDTDEEIEDFYAGAEERHRQEYKEWWDRFAAHLPLFTDPPLCNNYGRLVPSERVEKITRRKKDNLYIVKYRDFCAGRYSLSYEDSDRLDAEFDADYKLFGMEESQERRRVSTFACMELIFETWWASSFDGVRWWHGTKRKKVVALAESLSILDRIVLAVDESESAQG